jgi:hypothetical protein
VPRQLFTRQQQQRLQQGHHAAMQVEVAASQVSLE